MKKLVLISALIMAAATSAKAISLPNLNQNASGSIQLNISVKAVQVINGSTTTTGYSASINNAAATVYVNASDLNAAISAAETAYGTKITTLTSSSSGSN